MTVLLRARCAGFWTPASDRRHFFDDVPSSVLLFGVTQYFPQSLKNILENIIENVLEAAGWSLALEVL